MEREEAGGRSAPRAPRAPGEFAAGAVVAGYRLDELIGRGGMAVVYRAFDGRLQRWVALKVLAPDLLNDEEFRQRFIRESRAAAAVDHPNILPVFQAGEADGVLFIAMRYVQGGDVRRLIGADGPMVPARACGIVAQVASALDTAHAHGLVHRDVKPANMLRDSSPHASQPEHVYLADFGLSKRSLATSGLTSRHHFLGTLNYVAPEQIQGQAVDGRADEYALACSAFEMLGGEPPFSRNDNMAIMWAQVNAPPPALTERRGGLPPAVDGVMARALAKRPGDRYATCQEFAAALASACEPAPARAGPGGSTAPATRVVAPQRPARPAPPPAPSQPAPPGPGTAGPRRPWLARRQGVTVAAASVVVLGAVGGYLLLGTPGHPHAAAAHRSRSASTTAGPVRSATVIAPPACTTQAAAARVLPHVPTHLVNVGQGAFDVTVTHTGLGFVSDSAGVTVLDTARPVPVPLRTVPLSSSQGEALTRDGRYLLVAAGSGMTVFKVSALAHGGDAPLGSLSSPGGKHAVEVAVSPDGRFAFVSLQDSHQVAVFNLARALASGFGPADEVGIIQLSKDPVGMAVAPDGRSLYVAAGLARPASASGQGDLVVVDLAKAEVTPASSVVKVIGAGCGPDRLVISPDGRYLWLTAGGGNALLAYSTVTLLTDPRHALVARVALGELPLGLVFARHGSLLVVADSNRDQLAGATSSLAVVGVRRALAGQSQALLGLIASGVTPRQFALEPGGTTLLVTNTKSGQVEAVDVTHLP